MFPSVACYSIDSGGLVTPIAERKFWNQCFCEHVSQLMFCRDMFNRDGPVLLLLSDEMELNIFVLCPPVEFRIFY